MFQTTSQMQLLTKERVRGGAGALSFRYLFSAEQLGGRAEMMAVITLAPGDSIGAHAHVENAEVYLVLSGTPTVEEDGVARELQPGDAEFCADGHSHAIENRSQQPVQILALLLPNKEISA